MSPSKNKRPAKRSLGDAKSLKLLVCAGLMIFAGYLIGTTHTMLVYKATQFSAQQLPSDTVERESSSSQNRLEGLVVEQESSQARTAPARVAAVPTVAKDSNRRVFEAENMYREVGSVLSHDDASGKSTAFGAVQEDGFLNYGPFTREFSGTDARNEAVFRLSIDTIVPEAVVRIDVSADGMVIAQRSIFGHEFVAPRTFQEFPLAFMSPPEGQQVEFRVHSKGFVGVHFDNVAVTQVTEDRQ